MARDLKKVSIIGHFGFGFNLLNGQTIKTKIVTDQLIKDLGENQVLQFDTHGGFKSLFKLPFQIISALRNSKNVVIFPAHNGLKLITPILSFFNLFYHRQLHYCVIGGWMPKMMERNKMLRYLLKKFKGIYVETNTMKKSLEAQGFSKILVMPNCKELKILKEDELVYPHGEPYRLCTFSRVMKEKGIEEAVKVVKRINEKKNRIVYTLDIYGQIDTSQIEWFNALKNEFPDFIRYCGLVPYDKSVDVLKDYFALLFPTHFFTEGIPGTIIDAYAAGIPVISAKWESFDDLVEEGETGFGYDFNSTDELSKLLETILCDNEQILLMKKKCLKKSNAMAANKLINILTKNLE